MSEGTPGPKRAADKAGDASVAGLSAFVAKVLNQLSLSAWLPAAIFITSATVLGQFRTNRSWSLNDALTNIAENWLTVVLLTIPALVISTILTQAFSFGAIRVLEGYWVRRGPASWLRTALIWRHVKRRERLVNSRHKAAKKAFLDVREDYIQVYGSDISNALEKQALEMDVDLDKLSDHEKKIYAAISWRNRCKPWALANVDQLSLQLRDYPPLPRRTMPTRLGNVLRATEDTLKNAGDDIQGFAMRRRELVSERIQIQHDQFRDRLDMYCTLVFVSGVIALGSVGLLWGRFPELQIALCAGSFAAFAVVCYGSAVASARGYCAALKVMDAAEPPAAS